jgi:FkbM family methyltransferase
MTFISYAQNFEDIILWRALKNVDAGFYVDIGAAWPDAHSVTKAFYLRGWSGINVEPNPDFYAQLCGQRPRDINIQIAVTNYEGKVELNLFRETGLSTLDIGVAQRHIKDNFYCVPLRVSTSTLANVLRRYLPTNQEVHFLKVDVEGLEGEVLSGNDWSVNRPWIILIESTQPLSQRESHHAWESRLIEAAYTFAYADGLNRFYVENSRLELLAAFKYPPNVFDEFVLASEIDAEEHRHQAEARAAVAEECLRQVEARAANAEVYRREAEARAAVAEECLRQVELRAANTEKSRREAEARADALGIQAMALINSKSWRITKPLRDILTHSGRLKNVIKLIMPQLFTGTPKSLLARTLGGVNSLLDENVETKRVLLLLLNRFPRIKRHVLYSINTVAEAPIVAPLAADSNCKPRLKKLEKIISYTIGDIRKRERNENIN